MATFFRVLSAGTTISADDANGPVVGLEQELVIIPFSRLNSNPFTFDGTYDNGLITAINTSAAGILLEGRKSENVFQFGVEDLSESSSIQKYRHIAVGWRVLDPSAEARDQMQDILNGAERYLCVARSRWKGTGQEDQFEVLGKDVGMVPRISTWNSGENDGVPLVDFMTPDGEHETRLPFKYFNTNLTTSLSDFAGAFA